MSYQVQIIDALKDWGLTVVTVGGWQTRGSPDFDPHGFLFHHDVVPDAPGTDDDIPSIIVNGRSDLPGPLANFWLETDGNVHLCAAGRANHAGEGGWNGLSGNSSVWGMEANNLGTPAHPWPEAQLEAAARLAACCVEFSGFPVANVAGHKEWTDRKIDPHTIDMDAFRTQVRLAEKRQGFTIVDKDTKKYFDAKFALGRDRDRKILTYLRAVRESQGATNAELKEMDDDLDAILAEVSD